MDQKKIGLFLKDLRKEKREKWLRNDENFL